jgi:hypothetical protein
MSLKDIPVWASVCDRSRLALMRAIYRSSLGDGLDVRWGLDGVTVMSGRELAAENLFSAFALMIGGALGTGLPMALLIIWVCS